MSIAEPTTSDKDNIKESMNGFSSMSEYNILDQMESITRATASKKFDKGSWAIRREFIKGIKAVLGDDFKAWLKINLNSKVSYGVRLDFIEDTMRFLSGKQRTVSLTTWYEIMEVYPIPNVILLDDVSAKREGVWAANNIKTTVDLIQCWCSLPGGYQDMVMSFKIMFGEARTTDTPRVSGVSALPVKYVYS